MHVSGAVTSVQTPHLYLYLNWCAQIIHVSGHVALPPTDDASRSVPLFFAVCSSATATSDIRDGLASYDTTGFQSVHTLDMKYREISHKSVARLSSLNYFILILTSLAKVFLTHLQLQLNS